MNTTKAARNKAATNPNCNISTGSNHSSSFTVSMPKTLKHLNQWLLWKLMDGKKIPLNTSFYPTDPTKGFSFQSIIFNYDPSRCSGLGFIAGNGVVAVDLDHCITDGKLSELAEGLVSELATYTEISQSGTGLHLFFIDNAAPEVGRKNNQLEIYTTNHYIAMTGNKLSGTPADLAVLNGKTVELLTRYFIKRKPINEQAEQNSGWKCTNEDILKRAKLVGDKKFQRLFYDGDISGYPSQSEADTALMCKLYLYTGGCEEQMRELFSQSALGKRNKWLNREDYQNKVVNAAINFMESLVNSSTSQQFLQKTLQQEKLEITDVYTEEFLHHLAVCKLDESITSQSIVLQVQEKCKKNHIPITGSNGLKTMLTRSVNSVINYRVQLENSKSLNELDTNLINTPSLIYSLQTPKNLVFDYSTNTTYKITESDGKQVLFRSINLITQQSVDENNIQRNTVATLKHNSNRWEYITADKNIFATANKITELANNGLDVTSTNAKKMIDYLDEFECLNRNVIPIIQTTAQTGWKHKEFVFPGIDSSFQLDASIRHKTEQLFLSAGTKFAIVPILQKLLQQPLVQVVIGAALAAPLVHILKCDNIVIHLYGLNGSGKSTLTALAFSLFGNPNIKSANPTADTTKVGLENYFSSRHDLPAFIEDLNTASDYKTQAVLAKIVTNSIENYRN